MQPCVGSELARPIRPRPVAGLAVDMQTAAERLDPEVAARARAAELGSNRTAIAAAHRQREGGIDPAAEGIERDRPSRIAGDAELDVAAERVDVDRFALEPPRGLDFDRAAERVRPDRTGRVAQSDAR